MDMSLVPGLAVVTGASSGTGRELARSLAADGYAVVVAAADPQVHAVAGELAGTGATVVAAQVDLGTPAGVDELYRLVLAQPEVLQAVVLDAGATADGRQDELPLVEDLRVVDVDVRATVHLTKLLVPGLVRRASGRMLFVTSAAAPEPSRATYAASQAFVQSYAGALRQEVRASGVTVTTAVLPGDPAQRRPASDLAREAYDAMQRGDDQVVLGASRNLVRAAVAKVVPDRISAAVTR